MTRVCLVIAMYSMAAPAFAGQSCLGPDEADRISTLRMTIQQADLSKPECVTSKGSLACGFLAEKIELQYLQRKENGDADSCTPEVQLSSNEE